MPLATYAQEYECTFSSVEDAVFRAEDVYAMLDDTIAPRFPELLTPAPADAATIEAYLT
jgi:hypothetical protein